MSEERPKKKMRFSTDSIVKVVAGTGDDAQEFSVHETQLSKRSPFFRAALEKEWKEGQTRQIDLPEDEARIVGHYLEAIYDNKLDLTAQAPSEITRAYLHEKNLLLAKLYVFGEKVQDDTFCNYTMSANISMLDERDKDGAASWATYEAIKIIFDGTPAHSPVRRYFVDRYANSGHESWKFEVLVAQIPELATEVLRELCRIRHNPARVDLYDDHTRWYKKSEQSKKAGE